jgi:hypothetical protein
MRLKAEKEDLKDLGGILDYLIKNQEKLNFILINFMK